jgi:hypothetical protein
VRRDYIVLAVPITSSALAIGFWLVQTSGAIGLLACDGHTACGGAPPVLSWPFVLLLEIGVVLFKKGIWPAPRRQTSRVSVAPGEL